MITNANIEILSPAARQDLKIPQLDGPIPDPYDDVLSTPNVSKSNYPCWNSLEIQRCNLYILILVFKKFMLKVEMLFASLLVPVCQIINIFCIIKEDATSIGPAIAG